MKPLTRKQRQAIKAAIETGFAIAQTTIKDPDAFPDELLILPFDPDRLAAIFTRERMRLWGELHRERPESLTALATRLGRNVSRVRQDVMILEDAHLARTVRHGNQVRIVAQAPNIVISSPEGSWTSSTRLRRRARKSVKRHKNADSLEPLFDRRKTKLIR
jgi:predicted transcriptional regulator